MPRTSSSERTSAVTAMARIPMARAVPAVSSADAPSMSTAATRAPARASISAAAFPMPCPAPVTSATLSSRPSRESVMAGV